MKRRLALLLVAALVGLAGSASTGGAQTRARCVAHEDAKRLGYTYCGSDTYAR